MNDHYEDHPSSDDRKLAGQLAILARTQFGGLALIEEAIAKALALTRVRMALAIQDELVTLTPLEFHGAWLNQQSVDDAIDRVLERKSW